MLNTPADASRLLTTAFSRQRRPETSRFISIRKFRDRREKKMEFEGSRLLFTSGFTPAVAIALGLYTEVGGETEAMLISAHYDSIQMKETRRASV